MNEEEEAPPAPKKAGRTGMMILVALVVLTMGGAGIVGGLYAAGAFGQAEKAPKEDISKPRLVLKGEDPLAVAGISSGKSEGGNEEGASSAVGHSVQLPKGGVDLPSPKDIAKYQATYFQMPAPYTSNLADTAALVQISLAVSTYYDGRVIDAVKMHEMAMRSEILMLLAQEPELIISTPEGKMALQKKLTKLINRILREKSGYSGIDNVYFTNFVIQ